MPRAAGSPSIHPVGAPLDGLLSAPPLICLALTVLVFLLPSLAYHGQFGTDTFPMAVYDEQYYAVLAASTARGEALTANPYLGGAAEVPGRGSEAITFIPRYVAAGFVALLGLGTGFTWMLALATALTWSLAYLLCTRICGSRTWGIAGACLMLLVPYAGVLLTYPAKLALALTTGAVSPSLENIGLNYARRFNPALSAPLLLAFLLLHWEGTRTAKRWAQLGAGLLGGLLFYCYFFFAVFAAAFTSLWLLFRLLKERALDRGLALAWAVQMMMAAPFVYWAFQSMETFRSFTVQSREPYLSIPHAAVMLLAAALALAYFRDAHGGAKWLAALGAAALLTNNQHVVTGKFIEPWHFDANVVAPLSSLLLVCALCRTPLERVGVRREVLAIALTVAALCAGAASQTARANHLDWISQAHAQRPAFTLVQQHTAPHDVVLLSDSDEPYPSWVVYHTGRPVFMSQYMMLLPVRDRAELRQRAMCVFWLRGEAGDRAVEQAVHNPWSILYAPEGTVLAFHPQRFTPAVRAGVLEEYSRFAVSPAGCTSPSLRLDWLLEHPTAPLNAARVERVFEVRQIHAAGGFRLLRVERKRVPQ